MVQQIILTILLDAKQTVSDVPQGGISWSWMNSILISAILLLCGALYKSVMYIVKTYLETNKNREDVADSRHSDTIKKFDEMKLDRSVEMKGLMIIINRHDVMINDHDKEIKEIKKSRNEGK